MCWPLRQSTASQVVQLGPFVSSTDGVTPSTGLTIANTDIKLRPLGATSATSKSSGGAIHSANGNYYATLDAIDTATVGPMRISVYISGSLPVWIDCIVYEEVVYDALFTANALGYVADQPVNVTKINGIAQTGRDIGASVLVGDKTGFALTAAYDAAKTAAQAGNAMTLTSGERDALAIVVESHLLDEGDSQMLINAIVGAIGNINIDQTVLVAAIRADLERSGGNLNNLISRLTSTRAGYLDNLSGGAVALASGVAVSSIGDNVITATSIAASALNGKGDWNTLAPDNTGIDSINTKLSTARLGKLDSLTFTTSNKIDAKLTSDGLDNIDATAPTGLADTFKNKILQIWERFFGKVIKSDEDGTVTLMQGTGSTPQTVQTFTSVNGVDTINRAT